MCLNRDCRMEVGGGGCVCVGGVGAAGGRGGSGIPDTELQSVWITYIFQTHYHSDRERREKVVAEIGNGGADTESQGLKRKKMKVCG